MLEAMNWKKFLTENVLGECWDADKRPGGDLPNRTFNDENDMMELYRYIYEDGKWNSFEDWIYKRIFIPECYKEKKAIGILNPWIFCLGDEDHEDRCKMVAKFYGWEEEK